MTFETIEVTVQSPGGLDWNSLISAVIGGVFALLGVLIAQRWAERTADEARLDGLVESCRAGAMAVLAYARAGSTSDMKNAMPPFQRDVISLQAWGKRREQKLDKAHRAFAATITGLSREMAETAPNVDPHRQGRDPYITALDALVLACVWWEQEPSRFAKGDLSPEFLAEAVGEPRQS